MICLLRKLLNYKHYNLRGDVIVTTDNAGSVLSQSHYEAYGEHTDFGEMPTDKYRANTKVEDTETNLLLEGHRYRHLEYKTFMSQDPLEYVDGLNFYAYCGYNPWGKWDPLGLKETKIENKVTITPVKGEKSTLTGQVDVKVQDAEGNKLRGSASATTNNDTNMLRTTESAGYTNAETGTGVDVTGTQQHQSGNDSYGGSVKVTQQITKEKVVNAEGSLTTSEKTQTEKISINYTNDDGNSKTSVAITYENSKTKNGSNKVEENHTVRIDLKISVNDIGKFIKENLP